MSSVKFLYQNRIRHSVFSFGFYKSWAKRLLLLPMLIKASSFSNYLKRSGAGISGLSFVGKVNFEGDLSNFSIGDNSFIGKVYVSLHDDIVIGKNVCINDGVKLLTGSHDVNDPNWGLITKPIIIDDFVWIGMNSIILPGVHLKRGVVVGAGAVVSKSVGIGQIVAGNPAKVISTRKIVDFKYNPVRFTALNNAWLEG
ncbi:acyltransferase [Algoriphagus chordae]|uniref:Maltose O-acetyltransferase n=1 Tax=Algoriphagus chordae TaxID=237019 RepID=A0A2W7SMX1_9BACT|nr:DapH/DapD/GlmU-related protein [Algoriphagus chordae]PZX52082.1 maltose O-acetyltransferase [Algoriphagus chordae]